MEKQKQNPKATDAQKWLSLPTAGAG